MSNTLNDIFKNMYDVSAVGAWRDAAARLKDETGEKEIDYLKGVQRNAVMSGIMSGIQGASGILNTSLQAAQIADPTMYEYDIWSASQQGTGPYYDFGQLAVDQANARYAGDVTQKEMRNMTGLQKAGSIGTGAMSGAMAGMQIAGPWGALAGGVIGGLGTLGGIIAGNNKAQRQAINLNHQADIANQYAKSNFAAAFENVADRKNRHGMANIAARGGKMSQAAKEKHMTMRQFADSVLAKHNANKYSEVMEKHTPNKFSSGGTTFNTHGGYFSPDYIEIGAGGTHESNPNGGVQIGVDPMGIPNLVEQGEIIYDDYVFSAREKASASELKEFALPTKYAGMPISDIADKLSAEGKERPDDAISNKGISAMYDRLMALQEYHNAKKEVAQVKRELKKLSPEEQQMVTDAAFGIQPVPEEGAFAGIAPEQAQMIAACGGKLAHKYQIGGPYLEDVNTNYEHFFDTMVRPGGFGSYHRGHTLRRGAAGALYTPEATQEALDKMSWHDAGEAAQKNGQKTFSWRGNTYNTSDIVTPSNNITAINRSANQAAPSNMSARAMEMDANYINLMDELAGHADADGNLDAMGKALLYRLNKTKGGNESSYSDWLKNIKDHQPGQYHNAFYSVANDLANERMASEYNNMLQPVGLDAIPDEEISLEDTTPKVELMEVPGSERSRLGLPTWQRYAGAGYNALAGLANMLQKPDRYKTRYISPTPVYGTLALDRLQYNPYDYNLTLNQLNANAAATNNQIRNAGLGPSTGAALVAANYDAGNNLGNAYWQTRLANQQQLANVTAANNQAAQAEANFDYQRNLANAQMRNQFGLYNLQNAIQNDYLNKQAETQKWQAVSAALDASAQDLANIGRENFNMNMANSNPALFYGLNPWSGLVRYKTV